MRRVSSRTHARILLYMGKIAIAVAMPASLSTVDISLYARQRRNLILTALQMEALACPEALGLIHFGLCSIDLLCRPLYDHRPAPS